MNIPYFILVILVCFLQACSFKNEVLNCQSLKEISESDQYLRVKHLDIMSPVFYILDSLIKDNGNPKGMDDASNVDQSLYLKLQDEAKLLSEIRTKPNQKTLDSIWKNQEKIDTKNVELLLSYIRLVGLDSFAQMDKRCGTNSFIIFVHTPEELKNKVKMIIDPALKEVNEPAYHHVMWHLNGRVN